MDQHYFADVDLPFHVWVRETSGGKARWVLREAASVEAPTGRTLPTTFDPGSGSAPTT